MTQKQKLGPVPLIYPIPIALVGTVVDGSPNFTEVGDVGIMGIKPPYVFTSLGEKSYSRQGILDSGQFSLNFPNTAMMAEADFCGVASGKTVNKAGLFTVFYDEEGLTGLPMIEECPVNLACQVLKHFTLQHRNIFVGEVVQTYIRDEYLVQKGEHRVLADLTVLDPLIYALDNRYYKIGESIGTGYQESKKIDRPNLIK
jgi:flavin reductase (DIM6/NTAB) family NADH-FMN oxidoreductase RutF